MSPVITAIQSAKQAARDALADRLSVYNSVSGFSGSGARPLRKRYSAAEPIVRVDDATGLILECQPLRVEDGDLVDPEGRRRTLKGINVDSAMKLPVRPAMPSHEGDCSVSDNVFFDGDHVSFVGRPFPVEEAELHFNRIKLWGYNTIRYLVTWEALEHEGPGKYDDDFVQYTVDILRVIHRIGGLYVFLECHQDVWSRFSGGLGAPMWTLYAAGMQPTRFYAGEAAVLHNDPRFAAARHDGECYPKMLWTSNYRRLASLTMFTLFFAGETYFPHLKINGVSIQHYLQQHYLDALEHLWKAVVKQLPEMFENGSMLGFESLNEPNGGLIGSPHLDYIPPFQQLRIDTTPTVYQCFRLGMGLPVQVDVYKIALTGPQKDGTRIVDPRGQRAWLSAKEAVAIDARYGWTRSGWPLGLCIYADIDIWGWKETDWEKLNLYSQDVRHTFSEVSCKLTQPNFFTQVSPRLSFDVADDKLPDKVDIDFFINHFFVEFYVKFKKVVRTHAPDVFVMLQPPVLELPPKLKGDPRNIVDDKTIYCPHYYDGMSLMFKSWNYRYNVDTLGIMRGRYLNPVLGIVFGERAIRNCIKKQFIEMVNDGKTYLGNIPTLMSETGMPFDMNGKRAYEDGKYQSQTSAIDALAYALEGLGMHHTYWCYTSTNCHKWGDRWNNEDFSFWSPDDRDLAFDDEDEITTTASSPLRRNSVTTSLKSVRANCKPSQLLKTKIDYHKKRLIPSLFKKSFFTGLPEEEYDSDDCSVTGVESCTLISVSSDNLRYRHFRQCYPSPDGVRAVSAVIRPFVVASRGKVKETEFDLRLAKFALTLVFDDNIDEEKLRKTPTIIFLPKWHYPYLNYNDIYLTSGRVKYNDQLEYLEWYHDAEEGGSENSMPAVARNEETIIVKNNSGKIEDIVPRDELPANNDCPIS